MPDVQIFWDPQGFTFDSLGSKEYLRATDGDTPYVSVSIRMLSIDAPETHYPGSRKPSKADAELAQLAQWITEGHAPIDDNLAAYLHPRLVTGQAGTLQEHQGEQAKVVFQQMLEKMLTRPTGTRRGLFIRTADEPFDSYGRVLAYIAPSYTNEEREQLSAWERATFNLLMVRAGWAAPFVIYPSIPKYPDLVMFHQAAKEAYLAGRGIWSDPMVLTGYEFRMATKLYKVTQRLVAGETLTSYERMAWIERYCADMVTHEIYYPEHYFRVAPYDRLFIWPKDVSEAVGKMNLLPAQ
jgi:endonuclease YncB( thermonuclease family)